MKFSSKNLGLDGRDFMFGFHTVLDCCGLGFEPETDVSRFGCFFLRYNHDLWMIGTKLV